MLLGRAEPGASLTFALIEPVDAANAPLPDNPAEAIVFGNLYETLKNIVALGDDFVLSKTGGCGKGPGSQTNIRSCFGGPHILVNNLVVGGA